MTVALEHATPSGRSKGFTVQDMPLLFADDTMAVFNKPSGLAVHRGWAADRVTAVSLARRRLGMRVYPVHRLDRATSGVLMFALSHEAAAALQDAFKADCVEKSYLALVRGTPPLEGTIDHPIPRSENGPRVPAVTKFRRLATAGRFSLVEAEPRTGRLHQIRRHLKHLSHPLVGDVRYGVGAINRMFRSDYGLHRLALHARALRLPHPATGDSMRFSAAVSAELAMVFERLGIPTFAWS
ncbi:MAG: RluA family pseudouridine synthase [Myxococcota bacterium]